MHIVVATQFLPWPLTEGGRVAQFRTLEALQDAVTFTLVVPVHSPEEEAAVDHFRRLFPKVTVATVRNYYPEIPPSVGRRVRRAAGKLARKILSGGAQSAPAGAVPAPRDTGPHYPFHHLNPAYLAALEAQITKGCDILQVEFADMLTLGPLFAGRVPMVFVHHQLHFIYARRFMEAGGVTGINARYQTARMIAEEAAYLKSFDAVIVFSEVDDEALRNFCPELNVVVSPFPSPEEPVTPGAEANEPTRHFVFVASEHHRPNVLGFRWFMGEAWPAIRQHLPGAIVEVIGEWSPAAQKDLPHYHDIRFSGFVPELGKALQNKIMVVPVMIGSGIRTKILAAWGASCPVVTTTVGGEGLPGDAGESFLTADTGPAFAAACVELSQNAEKRRRIAASGLAVVQKHYSLAAVRRTRLEIYESVRGGKRAGARYLAHA